MQNRCKLPWQSLAVNSMWLTATASRSESLLKRDQNSRNHNVLPRYRKAPKRYDGTSPHQFTCPKEYFRQIYNEECDLLIEEITDRFEVKESLQPVVAMEKLLIKTANGLHHDEKFENLCLVLIFKLIGLRDSSVFSQISSTLLCQR